MAYRHIDNHFQHRRPRTPSPTRLDYDRALPPLADQPLLELRRPGNKDACFAISALSPNISKRGAGDWDSISGRTCLLDRFLGQQTYSSIDEDLLQSPSEVINQTPNSPAAMFPTSSNDLWTILSQRRAQNYTERLPARLAIDTSQNNQKHVRQPITSPALSTESAPVTGRSGFGSHDPPNIVTSQHRKSRRYVPQPIYSPALSTGSTPVMDHSHYNASYVNNRSQRSSNNRYVSQPLYSPTLSTGSAPVTQRSRTNASQVDTSQQSSREQYVPQPMYSPTVSAESASMTERSRSYIPLARLEGFPIPRAPSLERRSPMPAPLDIAATQIIHSRKAAFKSPLASADSACSFASQSQSCRTHPKLNRLVTQTKSVRFGGSESPGGSSMRSLTQTEQGFSSPSTTFSFSPVTPVAMTFDYPLIFEITPILQSVSWDDRVDTAKVIEGSPRDTIVPDTQTSASAFRGQHTDGSGGHHDAATRTRSHSPPKSAFPSNSPVYMLPPIEYSPMARKQDVTPTTGRSEWNDESDLYREVAELRMNMEINHDTGPGIAQVDKSAAGLDRTAKWVMCRSPEEEKNAFSFGSVASDREAIMRSYFQRL